MGKSNGHHKVNRRLDGPKLGLSDIEGPMAEFDKLGRIVAIIFERNDQIEIQFWSEPDNRILRSLRQIYTQMVNLVTTQIKSAWNK